MDEDNGQDKKMPGAVEMGKRGGKAAAAALTPEERAEKARRAAAARWDGHTYSTRQHAVWARARLAKKKKQENGETGNGKRRNKEGQE